VSAQVFDVAHSEEEPTRTLLIVAERPKALVLLYPGGGGQLSFRDDGQTKNRHTFVRSVNQWAQYHIDAVLVDTPYDLGNLKRGSFRGRQDHLQRVEEVVTFYKARTKIPIWIFGHSMGTSTATNFVNESPQLAKLLSGIIVAGTVRTAELSDDVTLPVMAIHHREDACGGSPISASRNLIEGRREGLISRIEIIDGGVSEGNICESFAYHGFNQTEEELIKRAAEFILSN
jgi:dienelactone hydrolase